ncbi:lectin C-type domain protein [Ancylostoma ceylanicum]|uniref:Lectin C-type domain protein n=1 Tax=Ancylostoma ceylanicum TaxID=53326 RepID=A0A0D6L4Z0_9BILA|nr:lectin C-type domain protein [Ancylostoma ceylanicum]
MPLCLTFIDLKKAFDTVETEAVLEALGNQGVPTQYIRIFHGSQQPPEPVSDWKFFRETSMCYRAYKDGGNFDESRSWCKKENGELASIHTTEHNEFLTGLTRGKIDGSVLIGLRLGDVNGIVTKEWTDGSEYNYERWAPRKPSSSGHCTIVSSVLFYLSIISSQV